MTITCISDTHGLHDSLKLEPGKILIHAGDITEYGTEEEVEDFLYWFSRQPFTYRIFIAGNHDLFLQECSTAKRNRLIPHGVIYLQNSSVEIDQVKIYGSPVTPYFLGMAFNVKEGKEIEKVWDKIPQDTVVLVTHGPPQGILDNGIGNDALLNRVHDIHPAAHIFGHAHGCNGTQIIDGITFVNAAMVNAPDLLASDEYRVTGRPVILVL